MGRINAAVGRLDRWQQRHAVPAVAYAVVKQYGSDHAAQTVVVLGWYGFVGIYPLLLAVVTVLGFVGASSLGHGLVATLHRFPVIGADFHPAHPAASLHGSALGLVVGLVGLAYGAQGVTQTALRAMATAWHVPPTATGQFPVRLARSLGGLAVIGTTFLVDAAAGGYATASATPWAARAGVLVGLLAVNVGLYAATFAVLTPGRRPLRSYLPGAALGGFGFTLLVTVGTGLLEHQVRHSSAAYGQFGVVIGLVAVLFLLAQVSLYGAELNPVLAERLWPRALRPDHPTAADHRAAAVLARALPHAA
ncbi:MAG: YihY/virulence factor BrkB family protein, partial [Acidimicrobiales bacterium]